MGVSRPARECAVDRPAAHSRVRFGSAGGGGVGRTHGLRHTGETGPVTFRHPIDCGEHGKAGGTAVRDARKVGHRMRDVVRQSGAAVVNCDAAVACRKQHCATRGDVVRMELPYGDMWLRPGDRPLLLAAGGTGISAILSLLRSLAEPLGQSVREAIEQEEDAGEPGDDETKNCHHNCEGPLPVVKHRRAGWQGLGRRQASRRR